MRQKIESYLGLARKAGKLLAGYNKCLDAIERGKIKLLIISEDVSENSMKKMIKLAESKKTKYRIYGQSEETGHITGNPGRGIFGITDKNFAEAVIKEIDQKEFEKKEVF